MNSVQMIQSSAACCVTQLILLLRRSLKASGNFCNRNLVKARSRLDRMINEMPGLLLPASSLGVSHLSEGAGELILAGAGTFACVWLMARPWHSEASIPSSTQQAASSIAPPTPPERASQPCWAYKVRQMEQKRNWYTNRSRQDASIWC